MFPVLCKARLAPCPPSITMQPEYVRTFQSALSPLRFTLSSKTWGITDKNLDLYKYHGPERLEVILSKSL